jgi:hypothetical protein
MGIGYDILGKNGQSDANLGIELLWRWVPNAIRTIESSTKVRLCQVRVG